MGPMPMIIKTIVAVADAVDKILSGNNDHAKRDANDSRAPYSCGSISLKTIHSDEIFACFHSSFAVGILLMMPKEAHNGR